jgi:hypothetical protein
LIKIAELSDIHNSTFDINHSSFDKVSYERRLWLKKRPVKSNEKLMNAEHPKSNIE